MFDLTANGPSIMAMVDLTRRANRLGIYTTDKPLMLTEDQQIRNYISNNKGGFDAGNKSNPEYIDYSNKVDNDARFVSETETATKDDLNHAQ